MIKKISSLSFFVALFAIVQAMSADGSLEKGRPYKVKKSKMQTEACVEQGYPTEASCLKKEYSYPGRIKVSEERDFTGSASFLYWQMINDGMNCIGYKSAQKTSLLNFPEKFKPALKASLGLTFHRHDDWGIFGDYMRYYSTTQQAEVANPEKGSLFVVGFFGEVDDLPKVFTKLHVGIDELNLSLGRSYYLGSNLICDIFYGLKAIWIHQRFSCKIPFSVFPSLNFINYIYSKDWALGGRIGSHANYLLGHHFRLFANAAASLSYKRTTEYKIGHDSFGSQNLSSLVNQSSLRPEFELGLGVAWGSYFGKQNWHFDFSAEYDFEVLCKEQNILQSTDSATPMNLYLHGFTVTAQLVF